MITTAVIMAAGKGTRFGNRTAEMPKGFIPFKGKPMIERSIENLIGAGIKKIIIGTGYHKEWYEELAQKYPQIQTVFSPDFANTNSMETLFVCRHAISDNDFILLESDIVYERAALELLLRDKHPNIMLVTPVTKFQDQYYVGVDRNKNLCRCSVNAEEIENNCLNGICGELVGIHKISNFFYSEMIADYEIYRDEYSKRGYEYEIEEIATSKGPEAFVCDDSGYVPAPKCFYPRQIDLFVLKVDNLSWYEIDDEKDLSYAENHISLV